MDGVMDKPDENVRRGRAMQAHYLLDLLTRGCRLPKGVRYAVRCADDCKSITVLLVSKRKYRRWPNWETIAPHVPCERIVEDEVLNTHIQRKTLYF
jgi:hypothetical protein